MPKNRASAVALSFALLVGSAAAQPPAAAAATPPEFSGCPGCGSAEFADKAREPDTVDRLVNAAIGDEDWVRQLEPMVAPIARASGDAASLEAFRDGLIARLNEMDVSELQTALARSAFAARIAGRLGADREDADEIEDPSADFAAPKKSFLARVFRLKKKP